MDNYKIKLNNEAEGKEAQELFFELGYYWGTGLGVKNLDAKFLFVKNNQIKMGYCSDNFSDSDSCELTITQLRDIVAQSKPTEQCLISGADALRALADGKEVENWNGSVWWDVDKTWQVGAFMADRKFRIKPRTITLNVEIPAPFEPKEGDEYFYIHSCVDSGYAIAQFEGIESDFKIMQFGAWRTEEEIKQVVAALRGGIKG